MKYCAFGAHYKDMKGIVIKTTSTTVWIGYNDSKNHIEPWDKHYVKIFNTKEERDKWIGSQHFEYDPR